jgi:hypothetical protein
MNKSTNNAPIASYKFLSIDTDFKDVVNERKKWSQREGRDEKRHEAKLKQFNK